MRWACQHSDPAVRKEAEVLLDRVNTELELHGQPKLTN